MLIRPILLLILLFPLAALAGTVQTRDGRTLEGSIRLEGTRLIVQPHGKPAVMLEAAELRQVVVKDAPPDKPAKIAAGANQGLRAEYFGNTRLGDSKFVRLDPAIHFNWGSEPPDLAMPKDFSVRWTGHLQPLYSETYEFEVTADDGVRLWIDGRMVIDCWKSGTVHGNASIPLRAGHKHEIRCEFYDNADLAYIELYWSSRSQRRQIIPPDRLTPPPGVAPLSVRLVEPASKVMARPQSLRLVASAANHDARVRQVEFFADARLLGKASQRPWQFDWRQPPAGYYRLWARATDTTGFSAASEPVLVAIGGKDAPMLPNGWLELPVGKEVAGVSASFAQGVFSLQSQGGGELWEDKAQFQFVCRPLEGDGTIVARLTSFAGGQPSGCAGVLIRENLSTGKARQAFVGALSAGGLAFVRREQDWLPPGTTIEEKITLPCWLKLQRQEKLIRAYRSADGTRWQLLGERKIELPPRVFAGLAILGSADRLATASFDQVTLQAGQPLPPTVKGLVLASGSVLAGNISRVDGTSVRLSRPQGEVTLPQTSVARLIFAPLSGERAQALAPGRTGALLSNGDFFDGTVASFSSGQLKINSVLFGTRRYSIYNNEVLAAVLREPSPASCKYEVQAADGSVFRASAIAIEQGMLKITEQHTGTLFELAGPQVEEIRDGEIASAPQ